MNLRALGAEADAHELGGSGMREADAGEGGTEATAERVGTHEAGKGAEALGDAAAGKEGGVEKEEGPARAALPQERDKGEEERRPLLEPEDYETLAQKLEAQGEPELAKQARQQGAVLRGVEEQAFQRRWWEEVHRTVEAHPELKDPTSELAKAVRGVLGETRVFSLSADGFRQATNLAKARMEAAAAPGLRSRVEDLVKENERLVRLTSVLGSGPTGSGAEPGLEGMSLRDGERHLRRLAAEHDRTE